MEMVRATSALTLTATPSPSRLRRNRSKKSSTTTTILLRRSRRWGPPLKVETPSTTTDDGDGDCGPPRVDDNCDYRSPKEEPKSECIDIYYHPLEEETKLELGDGDGVVVVNGCYDFDPPKEEPKLVATSDDTDDDGGPDVGYDCSHCGISLGSRKFKVAHELRCKVQRQQREFESKITKLYRCRYCRCSFVNQEFKEQHQRRGCRKRPVAKKKPSDGPYFGCDKCEFVTKRKWDLGRHLLTHNKNNAEWFTCTQCSYKTVRKSHMTRHMKIHSNIFSCCCSICGRSFRTKQQLDNHLLNQHSDGSDEVSKLITSKIYRCNICDRFRTTRKGDFNRHLTITHMKGVGCQKYECPRCPFSTFSKQSLTKHSKRHAEQKDYQCTVCKKQFVRKRDLDLHVLHNHADNIDLMKTITSKLHHCESCSFKTIERTTLKRHVRLKHI